MRAVGNRCCWPLDVVVLPVAKKWKSCFLVGLLTQPMTDKLYLGAAAQANYQPNTYMHLKLLQRLSSFFCLVLALLGFNYRAASQLSVGPTGLASQTFDALPPVANWSTLSVGPGVACGAITT